MVSPFSRRRAVRWACESRGQSERHACRLVGMARSTHRYQGRRIDADAELVKRIHEVAVQHPRYGYRRVTTLIRRSGWLVNRKRVHRLWRQEGLRVPSRQRKKRRLGHGGNGILRRKAERPNRVWSYDFVFDETENGRALKILPVVDEFSRKCLTIEVGRSITAQSGTGVGTGAIELSS